jgi:hypothetical protein
MFFDRCLWVSDQSSVLRPIALHDEAGVFHYIILSSYIPGVFRPAGAQVRDGRSDRRVCFSENFGISSAIHRQLIVQNQQLRRDGGFLLRQFSCVIVTKDWAS